MNLKATKIWKWTIIVVGISIAIGLFLVIYIPIKMFSELRDDIWNIRNRKILHEYFSPDSLNVVGIYHYDSGALGYTAMNVSLIHKNTEYPIEGNIMICNLKPNVVWESNSLIIIKADTSQSWTGPKERLIKINGIEIKYELYK